MTSRIQRPDVDRILCGLKDFQRRTVDYVFSRMYEDARPAHRFLVADEVGLGKTLVARGVIARTLDHLWERVDRLDVIYICSNGDIARQNVERLNVLDQKHVSMATRLTMLPAELKNLQGNKVNFVSFTPGTSFDLKSSTGRASERVLLYWMLREAWGFGLARAPLYILRGYSTPESFEREVRRFKPEGVDTDLMKAFHEALAKETQEQTANGLLGLRARFDQLRGIFTRVDVRVTNEQVAMRNAFVGDLRRLLAATCIRKLEPDLIIMDEFQRFKSLLGGQDEAALLAQELFNYEDSHSRARVLLLSATPYKMYTTPDGATDDDHYSDFLETLKFLQHDAAETERVRLSLEEYRKLLLRLGPDTTARLVQIKSALEQSLRRVMARTERLAVSEDRNGMLVERPAGVPAPDARSVRNYSTLQLIARELEHPDIVEYWKAAPYLLNFMRDYKFKEKFKEHLEADGTKLTRLLAADEHLLAGQGVLRGKEPLDPPHARMRWLLDDTVGRGLWQLLWLPPSLPYYQLGEPFASLARQNVTKRLIFSAWKVVPRAIAALVSYEAERQMLDSVSAEHPTVDAARESISEPLKFARSDGRLSGMPALGILYPSFTLAALADPLDSYFSRPGSNLPTQAELLAAIKVRLTPELDRLIGRHATGETAGAEDEAWYWAAPILLDLQADEARTRAWLERPDAARQWVTGTSGEEQDEHQGWTQHVVEAVEMLRTGSRLGRVPRDLADVVALQALAGPGVVALRSISRVTGGETAQRRDYVRDAAGAIAWSIRNLFNLPESVALVRKLYPDQAYWRALTMYCAAGGLQAVLDEYQHVLPESVGLVGSAPEKVAERVSEEVRQALGVRTAMVVADDVEVGEGGKIGLTSKRFRARFAVRFGDEQSEDGEEVTRTSQLRSAFNSPFWPFVLATTTVGQEGLDFHQYCHAVVHWNLPSNPVDLEQREGRVHRYKGHAVRKNVAVRYAKELLTAVQGGEEDPWDALFELAKAERAGDASDIVPYWVFPLPGGAAVERHVPALPLSRDLEQLAQLRRTLAVYRMVFGQPRQDELLDYLLRQMGRDDAMHYLNELRIELAPV